MKEKKINPKSHIALQTSKNSGITIVALIITIIVLLILAVVAIRAVQGDGIIGHAKNARDEYEQKEAEEQATLEGYLEKIEENIPNTPSGAFASITSENYGDKVAYSAGEVSDWKVFYKDDSYLYIITSDYLNNANLPTELNMSTDSTYNAYWASTDNFTATSSANITTAVANKYGLGWLNDNTSSTNNNARATADLLDTTAWTAKFGDTSKGIEAIGSPTLEMWVKSWNLKSTTQLKTENNSTGYFVGLATIDRLEDIVGEWNEEKGGYYINISSDTNLYKEGSLYFPHTYSEYGFYNCYGYWLASPKADGTDNIEFVSSEGYISNSAGTYDDISYSVRPVVSIPSNLVEKKDASGAWTIK